MSVTRDQIQSVLSRLELPDGGNLISRDFVRAITIEDGKVRFVIEAASADQARMMEGLRQAAERAVAALPGVASVSAMLTAHSQKSEPPQLKAGGHSHGQAQKGPERIPGIKKIFLVGSGKGGVGKSTVSANLAVALAQAGKRVGLLDADIYGPSQPRMMGATGQPASPDGKILEPLRAHGVSIMSMGFLVDPDRAVIWRGPMLMGAMQQMLNQVAWGDLDVLVIDLPPGTGDVQLSLGQKTVIDGAIIVSTPQDVALLDARKALDMFCSMKTPLVGLIENMSMFICPDCGSRHEIFGHGGVKAEAERLGLPLLATLPIDLQTRLGGDAGQPIATGKSEMAKAYADLAARLIAEGRV
jgi:ATP-binding protein involved in chromosome partitioning